MTSPPEAASHRSRHGAARRGRDRRVRLFGLEIETTLPLPGVPEGVGQREPDCVVSVRARAPVDAAAAGRPIYVSERRTPEGIPGLELHALGTVDLLRFPQVDFYCHPLGVDIVPGPGVSQREIEIHLLGTVLAFWLERNGVPVLHASAIESAGTALVFSASNHGGKSLLAAGFLRRGAALAGDDLVALERVGDEIRVRPSYPQMRLWPEAAAWLCGDARDLPRVLPEVEKRLVSIGSSGFGRFHGRSLPLGAIYLPERDADRTRMIEVEPVPPARAVVELAARSFVPRLAAAAGWQPRRLAFFARLVERVPVRRLIYPSGYERLAEVVEAVAADADRLDTARPRRES